MHLCTCNECQRLDALPLRKQGIPGCRQLGLVETAQAAPRGNDSQRLQLAANSPMRPIDGRTADVDGLALFDAQYDAPRAPALL